MTPIEYIISELKQFILEFPKTRVRYEYDENSETHFVEVVPNEVYHLDSQYINWESEMFDRFTDLYPDQNICFISDDALVGLDKIDFELFGREFVSSFYTSLPECVIAEDLIEVNSNVQGITIGPIAISSNFNSVVSLTNFNLRITGKSVDQTGSQPPITLAA